MRTLKLKIRPQAAFRVAPTPPDATVIGSVRFALPELRAAAHAANLELASDVDLADVTKAIGTTLDRWIIWRRHRNALRGRGRGKSSQIAARSWAADLAAWTLSKEAFDACELASRLVGDEPEAISNATEVLRHAWFHLGDDLEVAEELLWASGVAKFTALVQLDSRLVGDERRVELASQTSRLITRPISEPQLRLLHVLAKIASQRTISNVRMGDENRYLMRDLAEQYRILFRDQPGFCFDADRSSDLEPRLSGSWISWVREVVFQATERAQDADYEPELRELTFWVKKADAVRDACRNKPRSGGRPRSRPVSAKASKSP